MKVTCIKTDELNSIIKQSIFKLLDSAFGNTVISKTLYNCYFNGYKSTHPNIVLLSDGKNVVGVAAVRIKQISMQGCYLGAITVGPVAIDPIYQGFGYSSLLLAAVDNLANQLDACLIYLVGINNFYQKYDYYPCLARSKIILEKKDIQSCDDVKCEKMTLSHANVVKRIYNELSELNCCTCFRSNDDWDWLINYAKDTYYFYQPIVVRYKDKVIGYYTTDPDDKPRIREAVYSINENEIVPLLAGLKQYASMNLIDTVEIMTPIGSPLYNYVIHRSKGVFTQLMSDNSGQLMKIVDYQPIISQLTVKWNLLLRKSNRNVRFDVDVKNVNIYVCHAGNNSPESIADHTVSCSREHFPGLLSNLYKSDYVLNTRCIVDDAIISHIGALLDNKTPFIYQGDNL